MFVQKLGFNRFSVEWPNRGFWVNKLGYNVDEDWLFRIDEEREYTIEAYKEIN